MGQKSDLLAAKFEEYREGHMREHALIQEALRLRNTETLRRLEELNHAHSQAVSDKAAFLTTAVFDAKYDANNRRVDVIQENIGRLMAEAAALHQEVQTIKLVVYGAVFLALVAVAGAILQLVIAKKG